MLVRLTTFFAVLGVAACTEETCLALCASGMTVQLRSSQDQPLAGFSGTLNLDGTNVAMTCPNGVVDPPTAIDELDRNFQFDCGASSIHADVLPPLSRPSSVAFILHLTSTTGETFDGPVDITLGDEAVICERQCFSGETEAAFQPAP